MERSTDIGSVAVTTTSAIYDVKLQLFEYLSNATEIADLSVLYSPSEDAQTSDHITLGQVENWSRSIAELGGNSPIEEEFDLGVFVWIGTPGMSQLEADTRASEVLNDITQLLRVPGPLNQAVPALWWADFSPSRALIGNNVNEGAIARIDAVLACRTQI